MSFGEQLKAARKSKEYTQTQLADLIGYGASTVSEYEKGTNKPNLDIFIKICKILEQNPNYFLQEDIDIEEEILSVADKQILNRYHHLSSDNKSIVDYILEMESESVTNQIIEFPVPKLNANNIYVCEQRASAGIGKIEDESNPELRIVCFEEGIIPHGTTHGIIIDGDSMEDKFFDKQIVFIQNGLECAPSDCGIFSVTDDENTKIYCKQLMQREDGSKYLHSINTRKGDPDINYKSLIDVHCIGKIIG